MQNNATPTSDPKDASKQQIAIGLLVTWLAFGSTFLAIKLAILVFPPLITASINFFGAGICLLTWQIVKQGEKPKLSDWRQAIVPSLLLFFLGRGCLMLGTQYVPSGVAALLFASSPVWVAILQFVVFREKISALAGFGLAVSIGGLMLLLAPSSNGLHLNPLGVGFLSASSIAWAVGSVLVRRMKFDLHPLTATSLQMLIAGTLILLSSGIRGEWNPTHWGHGAFWPALASVVYITIVVALIGFSTFNWLLRVTAPILANSFSFVSPAVAVALGWLILHEPLTARSISATVIILAGVALTSVKMRPKVGSG